MREILFRAKRIDNGEWVNGYYVYDFAHNAHFIFKNQLVCPNCINDRRIDYSLCDYEIDPETLCQYTGMNDKNGKRIWENDILCQKTTDEFKKYNPIEWEKYGIVKFGEADLRNDWKGYCSTGFYIQHLKSISINPKDYCIGSIQTGINQKDILDECYPFEVIGNIFDTPELLKKQ